MSDEEKVNRYSALFWRWLVIFLAGVGLGTGAYGFAILADASPGIRNAALVLTVVVTMWAVDRYFVVATKFRTLD